MDNVWGSLYRYGKVKRERDFEAFAMKRRKEQGQLRKRETSVFFKTPLILYQFSPKCNVMIY